MRIANARIRRPGAVLVEHAIILPVLLLIIIGTVVGGLGVFRYEQIATLAREGARYAIVHGTESGSVASPDDVYDKAIEPMATGLDLKKLSCTVVWPQGKTAAYADPNSTPPGRPVGATVEVTVSYQWVPEAYFGGVTFTSKSVMPMQY